MGNLNRLLPLPMLVSATKAIKIDSDFSKS